MVVKGVVNMNSYAWKPVGGEQSRIFQPEMLLCCTTVLYLGSLVCPFHKFLGDAALSCA